MQIAPTSVLSVVALCDETAVTFSRCGNPCLKLVVVPVAGFEILASPIVFLTFRVTWLS